MDSINKCNEDILVVTIAIIAHGVITDSIIDDDPSIFENVRYFSKAGGMKPVETCLLEEYILPSRLNEIFRKDLKKSTYKMINGMLEQKQGSGLFLENVPFDKLLTTSNQLNQGIYLVSIHANKKLVYPLKKNMNINLFDIGYMSNVADFFESSMPIILDESTPLPSSSIYREEERWIRTNPHFSKDEKKEKIQQTKKQFHNALRNWNLTMGNHSAIESVKLSYFIDLIKKIINRPCVINLLDYSCNEKPKYEFTNTENWTMPDISGDIESGFPCMNLGGRSQK
jgi:hypothetical protein